jgi:hypothetical protein
MADSAPLDLDTASLSFFRQLRAGAARVAVTGVGVAGDSGMASSLYFLMVDGPGHQRLLHSERDYRFALDNHQVLRAVTRATVCEGGAFCMGFNLGLDTRRLLPPFLPVARSEDTVFAAVLRSCVPGAFQGFLPWLVQHVRPAPRTPLGAGEPGRSAARVMTGQIFQLLIGAFTPNYDREAVGANLRGLAATLAGLGRVPRPEFEEVVRLHLWRQSSGIASRLETLLHKYGSQPGFWTADVRHVLATLERTLTDPSYPAPADLTAGAGEGLAVVQRSLGWFGRLLEIWPDLVEAARDLRRQDVRPARPV